MDNFHFGSLEKLSTKSKSYPHTYPHSYPHGFFIDFIRLSELSTYPQALLLLLLYIYISLRRSTNLEVLKDFCDYKRHKKRGISKMNFSIDRSPLLEALQKVQTVVEKKNTIQILGNILCTVKEPRIVSLCNRPGSRN